MEFGTITTRSFPRLAMSPPMDWVNAESSFTTFFTSSMLLRARGVILRISMFPNSSSCLMTSTSVRLRNGMAFREVFCEVFLFSGFEVDKHCHFLK